MSIFDIVSAADLAAYWEELPAQGEPNYLETKFPNARQQSLKLSWLKGRKDTPVVLRPSAYDVHVLPRVRNKISAASVEMPFFKESYYIDEELRRSLIELLNSNNPVYADFVIMRIFDDTNKLLEAAEMQRERMRASLLTTGSIVMASNGQAVELNYSLDPAQFQNAAVSWTNTATSTPITDFQEAIDYIADAAPDALAEAIMNNVTFRLLRQSEEIRTNIALANVLTNNAGIISDSMVMQYVSDLMGLTITIYNKRYRDEQEVEQKLIPDYIVVFVPAGNLGNTWFAPTPEEIDLLGTNAANVAIVDTGVAITTMIQADPVKVETKVSMCCAPSFERADNIVILDVA